MERLVAKGAEADLYITEWNGLKAIKKVRNKKKYRHPELDRQLTRTRTNHEADIIHRAKKHGVATPLLYSVDNEKGVIVMEHIDGIKIRDLVDQLDEGERYRLFRRIGYFSGQLHKGGIYTVTSPAATSSSPVNASCSSISASARSTSRWRSGAWTSTS